MWIPLKTEVNDRFSSVEAFFKATRGIGSQSDKIARGLAFVHVYAAYEHCVRSVVRVAIDAIVAHRHHIRDLKPPLMGLFLNPELNSFMDSTATNSWEARTKIFESLLSNYPNRDRTTFPNDGSHYRSQQLRTIFTIFGLDRTPAQRRRHLIRINEVVDNRNAIAHGQEAAEAIGVRYSRSEVLHIIRQTRSVCRLLITSIEKQCADKKRHCR